MKTLSVVRALRARPLTAVALFFSITIFVNVALVGCGSNSADTSGTQAPPATQTTPPAADAAGGDLGAQIYSQRCMLCHGPEGKGDGPAAASLNPKPRNHTDGSYMNGRSDEELLQVIHEGKGAMPAWKSVLSDEEIKAVLKHVRSLAVPPYQG